MKTGKQLAEAGMQQAVDHADLLHDSWSDRALDMLRCFLSSRRYGETFMAEDVRAWAYNRGLPEAPSARAWGSVINRAARAGLIVKRGFASVKNPKAHCTPAAVWGRA